MPLDINGYNDAFRAFTDFATKSVEAGQTKAIARAPVEVTTGPLTGRSITAATTDKVFKFFRSSDDQKANDATRKIFRDAIIDMFGGESKIPATVKQAMLEADYGKGKPLTARRILAVKAAIDASGTTEARTEKLKLESFQSPEVEQAASKMGFVKSEFPKLARAAHFYAQTAGVSELDALKAVSESGSEANRLMQYGGRFLESAENFADGLRLIAKFSEWHDDISAAHAKNDPAALDTPSKINADIRAATPQAKLGLERFIFEDIAANPDFNLKETDAERAFGVEHNAASRHMLVADNVSTLGTIANVPPEKRRVVYAAFNAFRELAPSAQERNAKKQVSLESIFLARILRHLPKLESIMAKGPLTGRDIIKTCFPDIGKPGNFDADTIKAWEDDLGTRCLALGGEYQAAATPLLESAGATIDEAKSAVRRGKPLPDVPFFSTAQFSIQEASSVATAGIATMDGDICRISPYTTGEDGNVKNVFPLENQSWKFNFPDGERLETNGTKHADIPRVGQKIRDLCGEVHPKQIGTVAFLLSQSGIGGVMKKRPLAEFGINTDEHTPVDFTLSRNAETGTVTITYASPKELPVRFSWMATVDVAGNVTTTPLVMEKPLGDVSSADAKKAVNAAMKDLGVNLTKDGANLAANLFAQHAKGMFPKNASVFANYIVGRMVSPLGLQDDELEGKVAKIANDIKSWDDFKLGDPRLADAGRRVADIANGHVKEKINDEHWFMGDPGYQAQSNMPHLPNVANQFWSDISSGSWNFNGTTVKLDPKMNANEVRAFNEKVVDQLNKTVDGSIKTEERRSVVKKVLTTLLHQGNFSELELISRKQSDLSALKGSELFASRDMNGEFEPILTGSQKAMGLEISKDGKTATVTVSIAKNITCDGSTADASKIGVALWTQKMTVDLTKDIPEVTNVTFSQQFEPGKVEISSERIDENLQISKE